MTHARNAIQPCYTCRNAVQSPGFWFSSMISGTNGAQHAVGITEPCWRRQEGSITIIHCYILQRNPPDRKGNHSDRETDILGGGGLWWKPKFRISTLYFCATRNFLSTLGLLKSVDFCKKDLQERLTRTRIVVTFLLEVPWEKPCMLGWQIQGVALQFKKTWGLKRYLSAAAWLLGYS